MADLTLGAPPAERRFWEMTGYQWTVLFAAWLGWGFDVFDGLLFNFVAPNCVPTLLGLPIGSPEARAATLRWTGGLQLAAARRLGRGRHPLRPARRSHRPHAHADADHAGLRRWHGALRVRAEPLGARALPADRGARHRRRVGGGRGDGGRGRAGEAAGRGRRAALHLGAGRTRPGELQSTPTSPAIYFADRPELSWRIVFLAGLLPAAVALLVRRFVREPERWVATRRPGRGAPASPSSSTERHRRRTIAAASSWRSWR